MKRIVVSILLILAIMMPIIVTPAGASTADDSTRVTSRAAHIVLDKLPEKPLFEPNGEDIVPFKEYKCILPWWMTWLCKALNSKSCPSCYTYMA